MSINQTTQASQEPLVALWTSVTIEADYRNIGVFPGLRIDQADRRSGTTLLFRVPVEFAREVLEHAQDRSKELGSGRGLYIAYRAMAKKLIRELDEAEGVQEDPGFGKLQDEISAVGTFPEGATVTNDEGEVVLITKGYRMRYCKDDAAGPFRDKDGKRFHYRPGYLGTVSRDGKTESYFWAAGDLLENNGDIAHLRLVRVNGKPVQHG